MTRCVLALLAICLLAAACADPETQRLEATTKPTYDPRTGRLAELTYDANKDGVIDTWTEMDGTRPVMSRIDRDQDGRIDRWEYYDEQGGLLKVGFSRKDDGTPDAWAYSGPEGRVERIEISSAADEARIDRREYYDAAGLSRAEEDTTGDGVVDRWETYEGGLVRTAAFDENGDGRPDRRLTYDGGRLVLIESEPDASGRFRRRVEVQ